MLTKRELQLLSELGIREDLSTTLTCAANIELAAVTESKEGDIEIAGWFVTEDLIEDRRLIVKADAFKGTNAMRKFNGRVLAFHDQMQAPVGKVLKLELRSGKGIYGTVRIFRETPELFKRAILSGVLAAFSIGFTIDRYEYDEKKQILTVLEATLKEVSIVNIGADSNALFQVKQALANNNTQIIPLYASAEERTVTLTPTPDKQFDPTQFMSEQEKLGGKVAELQTILNSLRETQTQAANSMITKTELAAKLETFATELSTIKEEIEKAKVELAKKDTRVDYNDYRSLIRDFVWLTDDNGNKMGNIAQRAYCLFQMPVNYDKIEAGQQLKNLRDLYDAVLVMDAMSRYTARDRYSIQQLKYYKELVKCTAAFDNEVALAMAGGNTGYGAEWLPTEMSSEFSEILRTTPMLMSKFPVWNMPRGGSAKYPFQNGKAVVYKGSEALVDNASEARKTSIATGVKTFTPETFIGALVASEEITEDAVLDMVSFIRNELAVALLEALESAIINGDDSATHIDNSATTLYESYMVETAFKGLRKLSLAGTGTYVDIETLSASTGVGALEIGNFTELKGMMEVAGLKPAECLYITGIKGRTAVQNALFKEDALGVLAFMLSGQIPNIDGSEIYVSGQFNEQLQSAGIYVVGTDVKHTALICAHKPSFRIGQRRGVTLEFNKNILTQQRQFVATARWDFGKISADSIKPVVQGYNIQHTA